MQQRAALARAILHEPRILLLDEPETGLDEAARNVLEEIVVGWAAQGRSVVLASHRLEWAQGITDRALVLDRGLIADEVRPGADAAARLVDVYRQAAARG